MGVKNRLSSGQELDLATRARISVYWYWPAKDGSAPHVGFGRSTAFIWLRPVQVLWSLGTGLYLFLVDPAIKPRVHGIARYGVLTIASLALGTVERRESKSTGYYKLDANGLPVRFLSKQVPDAIKGRFGVRHSAFIRATQGAEETE